MAQVDGLVQQINVEIEGLKGVAVSMREDLEGGFRTQVAPIHDALRSGARIGGCIPGYEFIQLQNLYSSHIERTLDALFQLDLGTQRVAEAAAVIAKTYGDSDAFAEATVEEIQGVISYAAPPPPPGRYSPSTTPTPTPGASSVV